MSVRIVVADDQEVVRAGFTALLCTQPDFEVVASAADGGEAVRVCLEHRPEVVLMDVRMPVIDGIEATRQIMAHAVGGAGNGRHAANGGGDRDADGDRDRDRGGGGGRGDAGDRRGGGGGGSGGRGDASDGDSDGGGESGGGDDRGDDRGDDGDRGSGSGGDRGSGDVGYGERERAGDTDGGGIPRIIMLTTFDLDEYIYDALSAGASGFLLKDVTAERLFDAVRVVAAGEALIAPAITRRLINEFARLRPRPPMQPAQLTGLTPRETEVLRLIGHGLSNLEIARYLMVGDETVKTHVRRVLAKLGARDRVQAVVTAYESGLVVPRSADTS